MFTFVTNFTRIKTKTNIRTLRRIEMSVTLQCASLNRPVRVQFYLKYCIVFGLTYLCYIISAKTIATIALIRNLSIFFVTSSYIGISILHYTYEYTRCYMFSQKVCASKRWRIKNKIDCGIGAFFRLVLFKYGRCYNIRQTRPLHPKNKLTYILGEKKLKISSKEIGKVDFAYQRAILATIVQRNISAM